jgi:hypothetical protein
MKGIEELEEMILIETNDFDYPIGNVRNDVYMRNQELSENELFEAMSSFIGSMVAEEYVTLKMKEYRKHSDYEDAFELVSERDATKEESDLILKQPELWTEKDVFSCFNVIELSILPKGREKLEKLNANHLS